MGIYPGVDYVDITDLNKANYEALRTSTIVAIKYIGVQDILLVGDGHDQQIVDWVEGVGGHNGGTISRSGNKTLYVTGCNHNLSEFEGEVAKFSARKIEYVP